MSLSNILEPNNFEIYAIALDGNGGSLNIGKDTTSTATLHLGDTSTPVYINEQLYSGLTGLTVGPVGSSPNANGMVFTGSVLSLEPANGTYPGVLTTTVQTISGEKTFNNGIAFANATLSYVPLALDYYETFSTTYAMTGAANVNFVCTFTRIGKLVTLSWDSMGFGVATTSAAQLTTVANAVPARFSKSSMTGVINVIDGPLNASIKTGCIFFLSGGAINITAEANGNFTNPGFCGFVAGAISYSV